MRLACALLLAHVAARPQQRAKPLTLKKPVTGRAAAKPVSSTTALCVSGGTIAKASDAEMRQAVEAINEAVLTNDEQNSTVNKQYEMRRER